MTDPDRRDRLDVPVLLPRHALLLCLFAGGAMILAGILANGLGQGFAVSQGPGPASGPEALPVPSPAWFIWATGASELAVGLAMAVAWLVWRSSHLVGLGPTAVRAFLTRLVPAGRPSARVAIGALLLALSVAPFADLAARWAQLLLGIHDTSGDIVARIVQMSGRAEFVVMLVTLAVLPALVEELLFRGVVFGAFARKSGTEALLVSSLLFAAFHLDPTQAAGTFLLGLAFGFARLCSGTLLTSVFAHALYNAFVLFILRFGAHVPTDPASSVSAAPLVVGAVGSCLGVWLLLQHRVSSSNG